MALPRHPGQDDETPVDKGPSRGTKLVVALVTGLVILVVVLHLTGVIGGH